MTTALAQREWDRLLHTHRTVPKPPLRRTRTLRAEVETWQAWREEGGRWVPDSWLRPGHFADPPQFDPLSDERLRTPAFEARCFQAAPAGEPTDVVIPLGTGSRHGDAELRYALRSIERHLENLGRVWIIGQRPDWAQGVEHIQAQDDHAAKDTNIIRKLELACQAGVSDRFVFWSDDQVLLRPLAWSQFGPYTWGSLNGRPTAGKRWQRRLLATRDWLQAGGHTALHCDTHVPIPIERSAFLGLVERSRDAWEGQDGLCVGTWYVNGRTPSIRPVLMGGRKAVAETCLDAASLRRAVAGRWFLGHNDAGFTSELRALLDELFPEPCQFERQPKIRVKPAGPTLSVIIPTLGRPTLKRTLESICGQNLIDGDEVLVVQDGPSNESTQRVFGDSGLPGRYLATDKKAADFGATPRNFGMEHAHGDYLAFMDDDDTYRPGAVAAIRRAITWHPDRPLMFRNHRTTCRRTRWEDKTVRAHNVGTPMFVVPNKVHQLGQWPSHRGSDFGFIHETLVKWVRGSLVWQPEILSDYLKPNSLGPRPMIRNLLYHVYPVAANEEWHLNVQRLLRYWDVFNGRKLVGIVTGPECDDQTEVQQAFPNDSEIEWLVEPNNPVLGERLTFQAGLRRLRSLNPDEATFYAHAKGVVNSCARRVPPERKHLVIPSVRHWRNRMYDAALRNPDHTDDLLRKYACVGPYRRIGDVGRAHQGPGDVPCLWFFAGAFYWFNHMYYFGHPRPVRLRQNRWAPEYHMGSIFPASDTYSCLKYPLSVDGRFYYLNQEEWEGVDHS